MGEPQLDLFESSEEFEVCPEVAEAIDRGLLAAKQGHVVSSEDVRKRISEWTSKFSTPNPR